MSKLSWTLLLIASMAGIALMYPILKTLGNSVDPFTLAFFRFSIAAVALLPLVLL
jgi:drug/metabolite transporter (DMT)-like permease